MPLSEDGLFLASRAQEEMPAGTIQMYYRDQKSVHVTVMHMESVFKTLAC